MFWVTVRTKWGRGGPICCLLVGGKWAACFLCRLRSEGVINEAAAKKDRSINVSFPSSPSEEARWYSHQLRLLGTTRWRRLMQDWRGFIKIQTSPSIPHQKSLLLISLWSFCALILFFVLLTLQSQPNTAPTNAAVAARLQNTNLNIDKMLFGCQQSRFCRWEQSVQSAAARRRNARCDF